MSKRSMTRRGFLGAAGLGAAAAPGASARADNGAPPRPAAGKPRLYELGTVTFNIAKDWDLPTLIDKCEQLGLRAVELRTTHQHGVEPGLDKKARDEVRQAFADSAVRLFGLGSACEFHSPKRAVVEANIELAGRFIELAHDVGAQGVKVRPNGLVEGVPVETTLRQIGGALAECGRRAEPLGVEIWLEVHGRGTAEPAHVRTILDACGHPSVGITWNSNPQDVQDGSVRRAFDLLADAIRCVHVHDLFDPYPYRELFGLLRERGYDRFTMVEMAGSPDVERLMKYYRALWDEMSRLPA